jgi:hypothetical protein
VEFGDQDLGGALDRHIASLPVRVYDSLEIVEIV